jgi:hypothetical protein
VQDLVGDYRKPSPQDEENFRAAKFSVYEEIEKLKDIIPSLLVLPNDELNKAIATPVIWFINNRQLNSFTIGMSTTDFQLLFTIIIAVRQISLGNLLDNGRSEVFPFLSIDAVVLFACIYQVIRLICEAYALNRISSKVARRFCLNPWHILDFVGVFTAMWLVITYSIAMENGSLDEIDIPAIVYSLILGLLWFRVLGFLKGVNEHLATFIMALVRIFFDIRFFCIVLLIFVLMFGDMVSISL